MNTVLKRSLMPIIGLVLLATLAIGGTGQAATAERPNIPRGGPDA
jgi:hypothetical protein